MFKLSSLAKSFGRHKFRSLTLSLAASAVALVSGCGLSDADTQDESDGVPTFQGKTAEEIASEAKAKDGDGKASTNLTSKWIPCGSVADFPTWSFWGYTTAEAVNSTPGTRIRLAYQSGLSGTSIIDLTDFARWGGRWAGFDLHLTYLGYFDSAGYYFNCLQYAPPPDAAPHLVVQTY